MTTVDHEPITIDELGRHASHYVALAAAGRRVPVTENGDIVAYLVPGADPDPRLVSPGA